MATLRDKNLHSFRLSVGVLVGQTIVYQWDVKKVEIILKHVHSLPLDQRAQRKKNEWVMFLNELKEDKDYFWGHFKSAKYGTRPKLLHGQNLTERENTRDIVEGDQVLTHFVIRKKDGLFLLEGNQHDVVTRSRIGSYFEEKAKTVVMKIGVHHVVLDILLSKSFFDEIESLEKVNSAIVEVSTKKPKNTAVNDSFADLLETTSSINGNTAILTLKAKYSKNGLLGVSKWAKKIKENPSVTGIKIIGLKNGAEHIINFEKSSEKIPVEVLVNDEGIVQTLDMYDKMLTAILGRDFLQ